MTAYLKKLVRENFHGFTFFYQYLGWRVFALFVMSFLVGLFDGFSLALFMPLLELIGSEERLATGAVDQLGSLSFLTKGFDYIGVPMRASYILLAIFLLIGLKSVFKFLGTYVSARFNQKLIRKIRVENIEKVRELNYDAYVKIDAGKMQNTLTTEVERVRMAFDQYIRVLQSGVLIMVYSFLAFLTNPQFALLVIIGSIISNRIFNLIYNYTKKTSYTISDLGHKFHGFIIQYISNFKYLKATGRSLNYSKKLYDEILLLEREHIKLGFLDGIIQGIREPIAIGVVIFVILVDINFLGGTLSSIVLSVLFLYRALTYVMNIQSDYNSYLSCSGSMASIKSIQSLLEKNQEVQVGNRTIPKKLTLEAKDICFSYGTEEILKHVNLKIEENTSVAFVGESGSGKTTLMNILSGLLTPKTGQVLINKIDYRELDTSILHSRIGYITQEPVIFDDTIFNNVSFWSEKNSVSINLVKESLEKASVLKFVQTLQAGLDANLGNNGINISGGQRQRISIAREFYKNSDVLFLDEATSALDSETELVIQRNIMEMKGKKTIIMAAHRLSTIKHVDIIYVLKNGEIIESGTFSSLKKDSVYFKKMTDLQEV